MTHRIAPYDAAYAAAAARIHAEGQPGTFLTSLGGAFLAALYTQMASSSRCYGYVALEDGSDRAEVAGVIVGTEDASAVFKDLILRRGLRLLPSVAAALARHPMLMPKVLQTLLYPGQTQRRPGEAELLFVGVRGDHRRRGIGQALVSALIAESRRRGMTALAVTVDATNQTALQLYQRFGLRPARRMVLYGRPMEWLEMELRAEAPATENGRNGNEGHHEHLEG